MLPDHLVLSGEEGDAMGAEGTGAFVEEPSGMVAMWAVEVMCDLCGDLCRDIVTRLPGLLIHLHLFHHVPGTGARGSKHSSSLKNARR